MLYHEYSFHVYEPQTEKKKESKPMLYIAFNFTIHVTF